MIEIAAPGTETVEKSLVVVPGLGFGASVYESWLRSVSETANAHVLAVTLAGFEGSPPPADPGAASHGERTWSRAAARAIESEIRRRSPVRPILIGHAALGGSIVLDIALESPELVEAVVLVASEPSRELGPGSDTLSPAKRVQLVDEVWARQWFPTVDKATWDANNWPAEIYTKDPDRARALWNAASANELPVLIRYLCELMATDHSPRFGDVRIPVRVLVPGFGGAELPVPWNENADRLLRRSWDETELPQGWTRTVLEESRVFAMFDEPGTLARIFDEIWRDSRPSPTSDHETEEG